MRGLLTDIRRWYYARVFSVFVVFFALSEAFVGFVMNSSPLPNGRVLPDSQSWNSSGSDEDLDVEPGPGPHGGVAEFGGVLSKVGYDPE